MSVISGRGGRLSLVATWLWAGLVAGTAATAADAAAETAAEGGVRRPNVLFVLSDDQRWDMLSVVQREMGDRARFPWLQTPNLDRIAQEGVRFRNAFVVNSLCAPSRATFLTGNYGHVNGIVNNHTAFPLDNATWASRLREAGYKTGYVGKWHMGSQPERPGFDFAASFLGQGVYFDCRFLVDGQEVRSQGYVDDVSTDYAIEFMKANRDRPFALTVGYKATHGPFQPPPRRADDYEGESARVVPNLGRLAVYRQGVDPAKLVRGEAPDVRTNLGYLRCIAGIDDNVGRLLQALDDLQLAEDTLLVFAGDNGYYLGEHGLGDKRSAYEESLRIPLLLRYPRSGVRGKLIDAMALNVDLAPTVLDFAGLAPAKALHGRSWRPLLENDAPAEDWRKAWFYCYFYERSFAVPMTTAVRTETAKLIKYPGHHDWTEMFDLNADPYELHNLYADPAHLALRNELEAEYVRQAKAIGFRVPEFADVPGVDEPRRRTPAAQRPGRDGWVLEYRFDQDDAERVVDASGFKHAGSATGAAIAEGRDGRRARRFDGKGTIEVPNSPALDPSGGAWTVEATFKAERPDGAIVARGGKTNGYLLHVAQGRPAWTVTSANRAQTIAGAETILGRWVTARASITTDRRLVLSLDGQQVAAGPLAAFIQNDPHDSMQIGADTRSQVLDPQECPRFTGLIESVRIFSGEAPPVAAATLRDP